MRAEKYKKMFNELIIENEKYKNLEKKIMIQLNIKEEKLID